MSESSYPSQQQDKFVLRLPDGMRDRIKAAAEAANRSMNAEIVATLEKAYPNGPVQLLRNQMEAMALAISQSPIDYEMTPEIAHAVRGMRDQLRRLTGEIIEAQAKAVMKSLNRPTPTDD